MFLQVHVNPELTLRTNSGRESEPRLDRETNWAGGVHQQAERTKATLLKQIGIPVHRVDT